MNNPILTLEEITAMNARNITEVRCIGKGKAEDVCYTADSKYLLVGSTTGIWRYDTRLENQSTVIGLYESGAHLAASKDSRFVASPTKSGSIKVWDIETGQCHATFQKSYGMYVQSLAFHPDCNRLASGDWEAVHVWDINTQEILLSIQDIGNVSSVAFSPNGTLLAAADTQGRVLLWDLAAGTRQDMPQSDIYGQGQIIFYSDEILALARNNSLVLWNVRTQEVRELPSGGTLPYKITISSSRRLLAVASWATAPGTPTIVVWDLEANSQVSLGFESGLSVAISPDERHIACIMHRLPQTVYFYDLGSRHHYQLPDFGNAQYGLAFSPDSSNLATSDVYRNIHVIDTRTMTDLYALNLEKAGLEDISSVFAYHPDGHTLLIKGPGSSTDFFFWEIESGNLRPWTPEVETFQLDVPDAIRLTPDAQTVIVVSHKPLVGRVDGTALKELFPAGDDTYISDAAFSGDGRYLAICGYFRAGSLQGQQVMLLNAHTFEPEIVMPQLDGGAESIAVNADGTLIAIGGHKGAGVGTTATGWLLDVTSRQILFSFQAQTDYRASMNLVRFSPGGSIVVYADSSGNLYLWDTKSYQQLTMCENHDSVLFNMEFSSDGKFLGTVSHDETLRLWGVLA